MCKGENTIFLNFLIKTGSITKIHLLRAFNNLYQPEIIAKPLSFPSLLPRPKTTAELRGKTTRKCGSLAPENASRDIIL